MTLTIPFKSARIAILSDLHANTELREAMLWMASQSSR